MATLSVSVMAHPVRRPYVDDLLKRLDRDDVPVIYDTNPVPSKNPAQRWDTCRRAWQAHEPTADWHLVLQDDAIPAEDLCAGVEKALDQMPKHNGKPVGLVSGYTGTGRPDQQNVIRATHHATINNHTWLATKSLNWGVAIIAPTWTIDPMLTWCSHPRRTQLNADYRIGCYYRDIQRWRTWHTWPSLVDHRQIPSLVGHDGHGTNGRRAHIHHTGSALAIDWTRTPPGGLIAGHRA